MRFLIFLFLVSSALLIDASAQSKCDDEIRRPIWQRLDKDILSGNWNCKVVLETETIALGKEKAYVVRGYGAPFCGATGNCSTWVVARRNRQFLILLSAGSVIVRYETKKRRDRYPDLVFRGRMGMSDHYIGTYKYIGTKYQLLSCVYEVYDTSGKRSITKARKEFCG